MVGLAELAAVRALMSCCCCCAMILLCSRSSSSNLLGKLGGATFPVEAMLGGVVTWVVLSFGRLAISLLGSEGVCFVVVPVGVVS